MIFGRFTRSLVDAAVLWYNFWPLKKKCGAEIDLGRGGALRSGAKWGMEGRLVKVEGQRGAFWEPFGMKEGCLGGERALAQPF